MPALQRLQPLLLCGLLSTQPVAAQVWVITDAAHPVTGKRAPDRQIALDAAQRIEDELSAGLPADPQRAESVLRQRLATGGAALAQRLQAAHQDVADAWALGVTKIPAVVVDQRYVVYGVSDLDLALVTIQRRKGAP
ncbi:TIGR03757 family integrating conjugative element protein [Delftia lacustris]|uniref:TIGR03757 family integrating conjugative element protein n=1 Tax=Delftia lacustris TaxID=558537 RepID=UPI00193C7CD8|nr:TIGR03757 family integrating conjugative element protein [Delftia lacustris]QRI92997.1 TIGR03757 family integrating conjugative element protein [Delftia lacustris]